VTIISNENLPNGKMHYSKRWLLYLKQGQSYQK
jgi:hypothetical protein